MKNLIIILTILLIWPNNVQGKTLLTKIEQGKTLSIEVKPIGDAYTDMSDEHELKIYKTVSSYAIEFKQNDISKKRKISKRQLIEVSEYITNWYDNRCKVLTCGLSYDSVKMRIGMKIIKFRTFQFSDTHLINKYFED